MSYWAWYFVKEEARTRHFAHRWGARNFCCHWLFWGPDVLHAMIRGLEPEFENPGTPNWAEGGMTVDLEEKTLTWFCEAPVYDCLSILETLLPLQKVLWPGWKVRWAARGLSQLLRAAGIPAAPENHEPGVASLEDDRDKPTFDALLRLPRQGPSGVISLNHPEGRRGLFPTAESSVGALLSYGPGHLIETLQARIPHTTVTLPAAWQLDQSGMDIDLQSRALSFWSSETVWPDDLGEAWDGWTIFDWGIDYRAHEALLSGRLRVELNFPIETLQYLEECLVPDRDEYEPYEIEIPGQDESLEAPFPLDLAERQRRWNLAVSTAFPDLLS